MNPHCYKLTISDISEGKGEAFEVFAPAFNAHHFGDTIQEALESYYLYFESEQLRRQKAGVPMPKSDVAVDKIKQVPLRLSERLYQKASSKAKNEGVSFNRLVTGLLEQVM